MIYDCPAWRNGEYCTVKDLNISVLDFGFIHCDSTYDVISIKGKGNKRIVDMHLDRFIESCKGWKLPLNYTKDELKNIVYELHERLGEDALIWLCVTRGTPTSGNPRDLKSCNSNVMAYSKPYYGFNKNNEATVCLAKNVIRVPDEAINQTYKNFAWNDLTKAQWEAIDRGFDTALLLSEKGYLTEGPGFNAFIIFDHIVMTSKTNRLSGITAKLVEEICRANDIAFQYADITQYDLLRADDMFLTSTAGDLIRVVKYEDNEYKESNIQRRIKELLWKY
jgi:branched-chain amino acid aminotransferase